MGMNLFTLNTLNIHWDLSLGLCWCYVTKLLNKKPFEIADMARSLIRLSGFEPDDDKKTKYIHKLIGTEHYLWYKDYYLNFARQ